MCLLMLMSDKSTRASDRDRQLHTRPVQQIQSSVCRPFHRAETIRSRQAHQALRWTGDSSLSVQRMYLNNQI